MRPYWVLLWFSEVREESEGNGEVKRKQERPQKAEDEGQTG